MQNWALFGTITVPKLCPNFSAVSYASSLDVVPIGGDTVAHQLRVGIALDFFDIFDGCQKSQSRSDRPLEVMVSALGLAFIFGAPWLNLGWLHLHSLVR